jgi:hypothetical protein
MLNTFSSTSLRTGWKTLAAFFAKTHYQADNQSHQPTLLGHSLITGSLLVTNLIACIILSGFASQKATEWLALQSAQPAQKPELDQTVIQAPLLKKRLLNQVTDIEARQDRHATVFYFSIDGFWFGIGGDSVCFFY